MGLEVELEVLKTVVSKLDTSLEKISEVSNSIGRLLAVHDERIDQLEKSSDKRTDEIKELASYLSNKFENDLLSKIGNGLLPEGMESLIPLLIEELHLISQSMPDNFETVFIERERVVGRIADLLATNEEFREAAWSNAAVGGKAPIEADSTYIDWDALKEQLPVMKDFRQFGSDEDLFLEIDPIEPLRGNSERLISIFEGALNEKKRVIFSASSKGMIDRYASIFRDANLPVQLQTGYVGVPGVAQVFAWNTPNRVASTSFDSSSKATTNYLDLTN